MKAKIALILPLMLLAACDSQPPRTLDQQLAESTTPADRKETLRLACLNEAEWPVRSTPDKFTGRHRAHRRMQQIQDNPEIREMKSLCRKMDDLTTEDAEEKLLAKDLAKACAVQVAAKKQKDQAGSPAHAVRIQRICEEMTGIKVK